MSEILQAFDQGAENARLRGGQRVRPTSPKTAGHRYIGKSRITEPRDHQRGVSLSLVGRPLGCWIYGASRYPASGQDLWLRQSTARTHQGKDDRANDEDCRYEER